MHRNRLLNLPALLRALLVALLALSSPLLSAAEEEYLLPDQAFVLSGRGDGPEAVAVKWTIAPGYYLYRSKFKFSVGAATPGVTLGEPQFPPGEKRQDEFFGEVEIYRNAVEVRLPVKRTDPAAGKLILETRSQGCADAGLCYPPHRQSVEVALAAPATAPAAAKAGALKALEELGDKVGLEAEDDLLPPEQAYQFTAVLADPATLALQWRIAAGTYLYQDKFEYRLLKGDGATLGKAIMPEAEIKKDTVRPDGTIGDLAVYHGDIEIKLPLHRANTAAGEIELEVRYQGCAERGVCYPPQKQKTVLALPALEAVSATAPAVSPAPQPTAGQTDSQGAGVAKPPAGSKPAGGSSAPATPPPAPATEQDRIAASLSGGNIWLTLLTFFGFGLLLAFTPCVFPMIPILSGIIAGQGAGLTTRKAFWLSLVYVVAMALTYAVAGVLAAAFGQNLQAAFQNPWLLGAFALLFVLLALSMFGFYELQLPSSLQTKLAEVSNRQQGGTMAGVAIMGVLSALIVGPCVAPPLAGALIYIGQTGDLLLGFLALFFLALGMGAPLILIGTSAGKLLPRAGAWMDAVKAVFGVGMLAVALVMLERIVPPAVAMVLWGALLICSAVYMGALTQLPANASGWRQLWKGGGLVLLVWGVLMLVGAAAGGKDTVQPLRGLGFGGGAGSAGGAAGEAREVHFKRIKSLGDLEREVQTASAQGKPVMLDFYADWCVSCKEMERYTFSDPAVIAALKDFVVLQADVTADDEQDRALLQGHFKLPGPPAIIFYGKDGKERSNMRVVGFMPAQEFAAHVGRAVQ